ncbi:hypothetical protein [Corynebacterium pelargi]|uniref:Uncharacterized protein n=1 Tax=Corynebacterium pelargi TaxID=1471400 RepID=A0A410WA65_9CORY|nr:hypothetical protein [Corynebacterium pelargi]QAU52816.1 hypothetical protein CPELA_07785 [Corynebacterium pelargi]GGG78967.1 hypothetical protein GCM10007338_16480 [Corynebacterium pelargi]
MKRITRCTAIAVALSFGALALPAHAANVVPGAETTADVVVTDSTALEVKVHPADAAATAIRGEVRNTSEQTFVCAGPKGNDGTAGDVAPAELVAKSAAYYQAHLYRVAPELPVKSPKLPIFGQLNLGTLDLGSSQGALQGSGPLLGQANGIRNTIAKEYSAARMAGHVGLIKKFTIPAGETVEFEAALPAPAKGARTDFQAAAFLMCTPSESKQPHVFTGYEEGSPAKFLGSSSLPKLPAKPENEPPAAASTNGEDEA